VLTAQSEPSHIWLSTYPEVDLTFTIPKHLKSLALHFALGCCLARPSRLVLQSGEPQTKSAPKVGADPQQEASQLERRVCCEGIALSALSVAELPEYDARLDKALGFVPQRLLAVPLQSDTGEPLAVLTLLRGYQADDPPKREWGDARLTPFSQCGSQGAVSLQIASSTEHGTCYVRSGTMDHQKLCFFHTLWKLS
jgi:hypothetical protein